MAEDLLRESGFLLPQSINVQEFLQSLLKKDQEEGFPKEAVEKLLSLLKTNNLDKENNMSDNKTMENLMAGFAGESQANRKYTAFSEKQKRKVIKKQPSYSR